jgi:hypothetical protein
MNPRYKIYPRSLLVVTLAAVLAACGGKDEEPLPAQSPPPAAKQASGSPTPQPAVAGDERLANAVVTGKTAAAVDLRYELLVKPGVGQPFEVELVFLPRSPADVLEVEVTGMPGLTIVNAGTLRFENVQTGGRYAAKVLAQAADPGLYYVGLVARMVSKVQTEARSFSVPVAVGTIPASAEKPAPTTDASGQPVESMPAVESGD